MSDFGRKHKSLRKDVFSFFYNMKLFVVSVIMLCFQTLRKMAVASTLQSHDLYSCPLCKKLLEDPVTIPCGRSFCEECINRYWDEDDKRCVYSCPQCENTFTPKPSLNRNKNLNKKVEELKKTASPAQCYAGPGDVKCDLCKMTKCKAVKSCLVCQASYCIDHLRPHFQSSDLKKHKLVEVCAELQEKISAEHDKLKEIFCRTDQSRMDQHKGHNTVATKTEEMKQKSFPSLCVSPGCDVSPSFTINQHLSFDGVRKSLSDLKKQVHEKEFNKLHPGAIDQHLSTEQHTTQGTEIKTAAVQMISFSEAENRREMFLQYFCYLTLDPNTANHQLILSEKNRVVTRSSETKQQYSNHLERFHSHPQVLCKESVCGRCYWELEWSGSVSISVSYKGIKRKGHANECVFGYNAQSWSLRCSSSSVSFWHNNTETKIRGPASPRIGVFVDHRAGTLSFYSVSDTMSLLHRVQPKFTQPLYAGFGLWYKSSVSLCDSV